ncbi:putative transcriptional regulator, partial [Sphingopyxis flava]
ARLLWAHKRTVQRWEAGTMRPTGAALALLTLVKRRGIQILT